MPQPLFIRTPPRNGINARLDLLFDEPLFVHVPIPQVSVLDPAFNATQRHTTSRSGTREHPRHMQNKHMHTFALLPPLQWEACQQAAELRDSIPRCLYALTHI